MAVTGVLAGGVTAVTSNEYTQLLSHPFNMVQGLLGE